MKKWEEDIRGSGSIFALCRLSLYQLLTKQRLHKLPEMIKQSVISQNPVFLQGFLNDVIMDTIAINPTPTDKETASRFSATQVATKPPTFVIFVNEVELMHFSTCVS